MLLVFKGDTAVRDTFRFLEEKLGAGLWSWNVDNNQMNWSVGLFKLLGFEPNSIAPSFDLFASLVLPEDRRSVLELERLARKKVQFNRTFRIVRKDGRVRTMQAQGETLTPHATDEPLTIGVISDTTTTAAVSEIRNDMEIRYRALIEAIGGTVWTIRQDGWATERRKSESISTGEPDYGLGYSWQEATHPSDIGGLKETIAEAVRRNSGYQYEHRMKQVDGSYRWHRSRGTPIRDANGEIREFTGLTTDIHNERTLPEQAPTEGDVITGAQIRAARGLTNWSVQDLSDSSGVSASTIRRFEASDAFCHGTGQEENALRQALEKAGAKFYFHAGGKPAVAPR